MRFLSGIQDAGASQEKSTSVVNAELLYSKAKDMAVFLESGTETFKLIDSILNVKKLVDISETFFKTENVSDSDSFTSLSRTI